MIGFQMFSDVLMMFGGFGGSFGSRGSGGSYEFVWWAWLVCCEKPTLVIFGYFLAITSDPKVFTNGSIVINCSSILCEREAASSWFLFKRGYESVSYLDVRVFLTILLSDSDWTSFRDSSIEMKLSNYFEKCFWEKYLTCAMCVVHICSAINLHVYVICMLSWSKMISGDSSSLSSCHMKGWWWWLWLWRWWWWWQCQWWCPVVQ